VVEQVETFSEEAEAQEAIPEISERPEWLPEKFGNVEDFVKSYGELEAKLGSTNTSKNIDTNIPDTPQTPSKDTSSFNVGGVDMGKYSNEYQSNGGLSESSYGELAEAGYTKEIVDSYIGGVKAQSRSEIDNLKGIYDSVGGMENYNQMVQWAANNMSTEEKNSFNSINDSGNNDAIKMNVHSLYTRYSKATGVDPKLVRGDTSQSTTGGKFESTAQIVEAMRNPKYKNDPAYRQEVYTKLSRSSVI
jgi:hypothetical protein